MIYGHLYSSFYIYKANENEAVSMIASMFLRKGYTFENISSKITFSIFQCDVIFFELCKSC